MLPCFISMQVPGFPWLFVQTVWSSHEPVIALGVTGDERAIVGVRTMATTRAKMPSVRAGTRLSLRSIRHLGTDLFEQAEQVLVVDGFLAVGEFGEAGVDRVELFAGERVAEFDVALFQGAAAGVLAQHERV